MISEELPGEKKILAHTSYFNFCTLGDIVHVSYPQTHAIEQ